jgi:hypothetical protein
MKVCVVSASGQNAFFAELLDALSDALRGAGLAVESSVDHFPPWRDDHVYLFVPHEYVPLVQETAHPSPAHLQRSVALCTEQPGTSWFEQAAAVAARAAGVVDINPLGTQALRRRGIKARSMQLGYVSAWDAWGGEDSEDRPVDLTFMGAYTERRSQALANCARALAGRRVDLRLFETWRPHLEGSADFLSGQSKWAALCRAKLIVNVHQSELGYLEWQRAIGAISNGCVFVTEHAVGFDPLVPGEHFVSVGYDRLPFAVDGLLSDPQLVGQIRSAAYRFLRDELPLATTIAPLVYALEEVAATSPKPPSLATTSDVPQPVLPQLPTTEYERVLGNRTESAVLRAAVKELLLGQVELRRELAQLHTEHTGSLADTIDKAGPERATPRVSVLLTVYNYADLIGRAIASVALNDFEDYELIVVDDASSDGSLETVRTELDRYPWVTATIITRRYNQGLSAARNRAAQEARGEFVFILDADNEIYPHALARLVSALEEARHASFAYGIIERFDPHGPRDLMGWQSWDPFRLRYGNYIDAMAMVRRAALLEVGGYTVDRRLRLGWEDFDLWCAFAERGWCGIRVPEILCRYRMGTYSMLSVTNIDAQAAWGALLERHAFLTDGRSYDVDAP